MTTNLTLDDLPDLSDWRYVPIWTVEQAVLIWGGINPVFNNYHGICREHKEKHNRAFIARQAFLSGIVLKTLPVHELYLYDTGTQSHSSLGDQKHGTFTFENVDIRRTTLMQMALLSWVAAQNIHSMRQSIMERERKAAQKKQKEAQIVQIEYKPLKPVHETPEFTAACKVVEEFWNKQHAGVKPPKQSTIQEFIKQTLLENTGVEPKDSEIQRVDRLTRPPCFKHQQATQK